MSERTLHLVPVRSGERSGSIVEASGVVGREDDCAAVVDDESVSRHHAHFRGGAAGWMIEDLKSTHGTFVGGVRVDAGETVLVSQGDLVRFGTVEFLVELNGPPFPEVSAPPPRPPAPTPSVTREEYQTRGSLLLRLGTEDSVERELSWQAFHDQYAPIIRGFARNAGCPEAIRDDLVQEVMSAFFTAASRFEYDPSRGRFRGYLKTATVHAAQRMRHKQRGQIQWTDESFLDQAEAVESCWSREWRQQALVRAVEALRHHSRLTSESWDAFELYGVRGVPLAAAAEQLGMSEAAVQKAKSRVAIMVREELERIRHEEG